MTMLCICNSEEQAEQEAIRLEVQDRLGVAPDQFTTALIMSIAFNFGEDAYVAADMWFGVGIKDCYVECDSPLDGLVHIWKYLADKYPDKAPPTMAFDTATTREGSALQIATRTVDEKALKDHEEVCTNCVQSPYKLCPEGKALWEAEMKSAEAIENKWGVPKYDEAPWFYGQRE